MEPMTESSVELSGVRSQLWSGLLIGDDVQLRGHVSAWDSDSDINGCILLSVTAPYFPRTCFGGYNPTVVISCREP